MRDLRKLERPTDIVELEKLVTSFTIFEKIEFSGIPKELIRAKLDYLRKEQVPNRKVLSHLPDERVTEIWFKNWLHPQLRNFVPPSPKDKRGVSKAVLERDMKQDMLSFYENGQQNFQYTLKDIEDYINET